MAASSLRILCAHQGTELYGSDRVFIDVVKAFRRLNPAAEITVLLPTPGPIVDVLAESGCKILFGKIWVLRRHGFLQSLLKFPFTFPQSVVEGARLSRDADVLYISTVVVLSLLLLARFHRRPVVHIHEIPDKLPRLILRQIVAYTKAFTIFNSYASRAAFAPSGRGSCVIHNGYRPSAAPNFVAFDGTKPLRLLMIGRLSKAKGQDLLIEALAGLPQALRDKVHLRIVGGTFGSDEYREEIEGLVQSRSLTEQVSMLPFVPEPSGHYLWSDVVVVPSRVVESFGLVAIEAMSYGKYVIASSQGGLKEVVVDGETGRLFEPFDVEGLKACLVEAISTPALIRQRGEAAYARFNARFGSDTFDRKIDEILGSVQVEG